MLYRSKAVVILIVVVVSACGYQPSEVPTEQIAAVTVFAAPASRTPGPTQRPKTKLTISPTRTIAPQPTSIPTSILRRGWFLITDPGSPEAVSLETAKSFIGRRIPPLPDKITEEFAYLFPDGGELPGSTIYHQIFVMRQGNARMIWLGIPVAGTPSRDESRIHDAIPMPPAHEGDVLIAFTCSRNHTSDDSLVVIASRPSADEPARDIHYAWRIDPGSTTLQPADPRDIECWSY